MKTENKMKLQKNLSKSDTFSVMFWLIEFIMKVIDVCLAQNGNCKIILLCKMSPKE